MTTYSSVRVASKVGVTKCFGPILRTKCDVPQRDCHLTLQPFKNKSTTLRGHSVSS